MEIDPVQSLKMNQALNHIVIANGGNIAPNTIVNDTMTLMCDINCGGYSYEDKGPRRKD